MVVVGGLAAAVEAELQHGGIVDGELGGAAHLDVVIGRVADIEAGDDGRAGGDLGILQPHLLGLRDGVGGGFVVGVDLAGFEGRQHGVGVGAVVDPFDAVEVEFALPPGLVLALHLGAGLGIPADQLAGAGGDRQRLHGIAVALIGAVHDQRRIVGHAGDQRDVGLRQIELDGEVVDLLDAAVDDLLGVGIDQRAHARGDRIAGDAEASHQRVRLWTTSSALKASPFDQVMPLRTCSVSVLASSLASQLSSSHGSKEKSVFQRTRYSLQWRATLDISTPSKVRGSLKPLTFMATRKHAALLRLRRAGRRGGEAAQRQRAGGADAEAGHQWRDIRGG